jgi:hypothetical protein
MKQPKLRWYQWRLRSLFILTLLVAIGMSWLAVTMRDQRKQHEAADAIEKAGGKVKSEPTWLGELLRDDSLVKVTGVYFLDGAADDAGLVHLQRLNQLQWLRLNSPNITDAGLLHLQGLSQLHYLKLNSTEVTDAGLANLQGLTQLERLDLTCTKVTDEGIKKFQQALPNCDIMY